MKRVLMSLLLAVALLTAYSLESPLRIPSVLADEAGD